jgi:hypothetical protein
MDAAVIASCGLVHPLKEVGGAHHSRRSPAIVRHPWSAPTGPRKYFATFDRAPGERPVDLHLGAKVRSDQKAIELADPKGLLRWLDKDRAMVTLGAGRDIPANRAAFEAIVRDWIRYV